MARTFGRSRSAGFVWPPGSLQEGVVRIKRQSGSDGNGRVFVCVCVCVSFCVLVCVCVCLLTRNILCGGHS